MKRYQADIAPPENWRSTLKIDLDLYDAGKRMSDTINLHLTFGKREDLIEKWLAFSLADGSSDNTLYDSKRDAVRHQMHEMQCHYASFRALSPGGVRPYDCTVVLQFTRDAYKAGFRLPDPDARDGGQDVLMTSAQYDWYTSKIPRVSLSDLQGR